MTTAKIMDWSATLAANALIVTTYITAAYICSKLFGIELWQALIVIRLLGEAGTQIKTDPRIK